MKLEEIKFDVHNEDVQRKAIDSNLGREVILKDIDLEWFHGYLEEDPSDNDYYKIRTEKGPFYRNYRGLQTLLLVNP